MWILGITAAIAFVLGEMTVLAAVLLLGTNRSLSTQGRHSALPVHRGTSPSPHSAQDTPQGREGDLGRWSFPSRNGDSL